LLNTLLKSLPARSRLRRLSPVVPCGHIKDEHFVPVHGLALEPYLATENICGMHHLVRYLWAVEVLKQRTGVERVLDIACGSGYGSYMLSSALPQASITGADYDEAAVREARRLYRMTNLQFLAGSATKWMFGEFDAIVSFDTLEHVPHREIMLQNIVEHLAPSGCLLFSAPCGHSEVVLQPEWRFHQIEYSPRTMHDFMRRYFKVVRHPQAGNLPALHVFEPLNRGVERYKLVMNPLLCEGPIRIE
jgi:SAM-dependent methyltransferase